jgi:hypothetical protein
MRPSHLHAAPLAACTPQEATEVYELIKGNFLLSQVFFELGREAPGNRGTSPLHALGLADMLRHTRLTDGDRMVDCFTAINQALRTIRNDPELSLFGFDQYGQVWIHQTPSPAANDQRTRHGDSGIDACRVHTTSPTTQHSMRHQNRYFRLAQYPSGESAEDPLAQSAMAVAAHH